MFRCTTACTRASPLRLLLGATGEVLGERSVHNQKGLQRLVGRRGAWRLVRPVALGRVLSPVTPGDTVSLLRVSGNHGVKANPV